MTKQAKAIVIVESPAKSKTINKIMAQFFKENGKKK